jgi:hypothetical protein
MMMLKMSRHRKRVRTPADARERARVKKARTRVETLIERRGKDEMAVLKAGAVKKSKEKKELLEMDKHAHHQAERARPGERAMERVELKREIKSLDKKAEKLILQQARAKRAEALKSLSQSKKDLDEEIRKLETMKGRVEVDRSGKPTARGRQQIAFIARRERVIAREKRMVENKLAELTKKRHRKAA